MHHRRKGLRDASGWREELVVVDGKLTDSTTTAATMTAEESSLGKDVRYSPLEVDMGPSSAQDDFDDMEGLDHYDKSERVLYPVSDSEHDGRKPSAWEDFLYPPNLPRSCQLLRPENIAVPMCYLMVGLLQGLSSALTNVFPVDIGASEAQQTTLHSIRALPASFKLVFGFMSDNLPIRGYRRKPYMLAGWFMASVCMQTLLAFSNLHIPPKSHQDLANNQGPASLPTDAPSVPFLAACLLGFGVGFWLADVMGDSIVAEKAKLEPEHCRGSVQSTCYSYRFFGLMVAAPLSTLIYSTAGPYYVILLLSILPLTILPLVWMLHEERDAPIKPTRDQCREIWSTVCSRAVWQPMGFVYLYNIMQVGNSAWRQFLRTVLHFSSKQLNIILSVSYVLLYLGILGYKYYFISWSWRIVYIFATLLNGFFSLLQVLLIKGKTFGLSPFMFALGDDAIAEFIVGIQFLPTTIMMVHLCPAGSEGASYAMFTTVNNSANTLSSAFSTMLLRIWDVSKTALESGHLQGLVNLTYLTTFIQVSAIAFVGLLPRFREDLMELKSTAKSAVGGAVFLTITFGSILYAVSVGVMNVIKPGWMGES